MHLPLARLVSMPAIFCLLPSSSIVILVFLPHNALKCICAVMGSHVVRLSVCPSVCPSVTLVICDHISWKSRKLIARTISPTPSLLVSERRSTYSQGNMEKFGGDMRWGREKVACWRTKAAISLKRVKIVEKLLWTVYRESPTLFRMVPSHTPFGLPFPKIGGSPPPPKTAI